MLRRHLEKNVGNTVSTFANNVDFQTDVCSIMLDPARAFMPMYHAPTPVFGRLTTALDSVHSDRPATVMYG